MNRNTLLSLVRCPECGHTEPLPLVAGTGRLIYRCGACGVLSRPKQGDCCVLCAYGDRPCHAMDPLPEAQPA